ncbi:MAG: cation:proton antiporter [Ardenticatenaceae bacterium]|nr:cation:proton antiporter [Ardenticatenaceae bacterium]
MNNHIQFLVAFLSFTILALAAGQIGQVFKRFRLPLISGFLFAGILVGPYLLNLISHEAIIRLRFVDEVSLAYIAFAAGSELYLEELRSQFKSITWVTIGLIVSTFTLGSTAVFLLARFVPFMQAMVGNGRIAIALLAGGILVARSPSSAIAIINELRAKGPFTRMTLGVTVIMDVVVIILFAINSSIADALLTQVAVNLGFVLLLAVELVLSIAFGYLLGRILQMVLSLQIKGYLKTGLILLIGYSAFVLSFMLRDFTHAQFAVEILLEPLLVCMIGSFYVVNRTPFRLEFTQALETVGPAIYILFFTLTGAALALDVLVETWAIALALFAVRIVSIFIGSFSGGTIAGDPRKHNRVSWMAFVTQAGVGLGLATEVAVEFPDWGPAFATIIISVIILNQIIGPPLFKWVVNYVGEARTRATASEFDGVRDVIIFGVEGQALALARQLSTHNWQVRVACMQEGFEELVANDDMVFACHMTEESLRRLGMEKVDAIVCMLSDEENYRICEMVYEQFGTETMVVRLNDRANLEPFHRLGARIIEPSTAMVSLLEQFVRAPTAASLLLGREEGQDVLDVEVRNPNLQGITLRNLRLPLDTLVLSVFRDGHTIISHGYTQLQLGDKVTVVGSAKSLEEVQLRFDG